MSWSDLPKDLLTLIFQLIADDDLSDLYQCLAVCQSWRFAAKELWHSNAVTTTPLLVLPFEKPNRVTFNTSMYNTISINSMQVSFGLPSDDLNIDFLMTYSCHNGWLLLGKRFTSKPISFLFDSLSTTSFDHLAYLYNPLSRFLVQLPPLPQPLSLNVHIKFVTSGSPPNCILCVMWEWDFKYDNASVLAFCKLGDYKKTDDKGTRIIWTKKPSYMYSDEDVIFYQGKFYTCFLCTMLMNLLTAKNRTKEKKVAEIARGSRT